MNEPAYRQIDLSTPAARAETETHHLLNALVVPRPIAWISTVSLDGVANLAPHSYFTVVSTEPPMVAFTSTGRKDTLANVEATGEFVVNVVSADLIDQMNETSAPVGPEVDEFVRAWLTPEPSSDVAAPGVAESPARLECVLEQIVPCGNSFLVIGRVTRAHVANEMWVEGRIDVAALAPVARLAGSEYTLLGEQVRLTRPRS